MSKLQYSESFKAIDKALEAIEAADHDIKANFTVAAANRVYYACYYCMTALLLTQNVYAKTHQGTRAKFSKLFIKTGIFSADIAGHIKNAFDLRQLIMILMQIFLKKLHWHLLLIQKNYTSYRSLTCEVCKYSSA